MLRHEVHLHMRLDHHLVSNVLITSRVHALITKILPLDVEHLLVVIDVLYLVVVDYRWLRHISNMRWHLLLLIWMHLVHIHHVLTLVLHQVGILPRLELLHVGILLRYLLLPRCALPWLLLHHVDLILGLVMVESLLLLSHSHCILLLMFTVHLSVGHLIRVWNVL